MIHSHTHNHETHAHHHDVALKAVNKTFIIGIALNAAYVIAEAIAGFATNSLALLSDAGHNLSDVAGLLIAVLAFKLAEMKPTKNYTYGFSKLTILAGVANAIILSIAIGGIGYSSIHRLFYPAMVNGFEISFFALIGILVNGFSAWLFLKQNQKDINVRGAYLHLLSDALVSAGVVVAGILIHYTNWLWLDPVMSLLIMGIIILSIWRLVKSTIRLSLDGVPDNINIEKIKDLRYLDQNIENIHHIHVWPISSSQNAMTAHVLIKNNISSEVADTIKDLIKSNLNAINIHHATLEMEYKKCRTEEEHR